MLGRKLNRLFDGAGVASLVGVAKECCSPAAAVSRLDALNINTLGFVVPRDWDWRCAEYQQLVGGAMTLEGTDLP